MRAPVSLALVLAVIGLPAPAENWPQWRGPSLNGVSSESDLPVRWSTTENIAWKLAMPGKSGATPIIWGNHVFLNIADGDELLPLVRRQKQGNAHLEEADRARQLQDQQAEYVVAIAGHRRRQRLRDDRDRRA